MNTKGLKTERTHEENQERAYIAASRRSDRSLEARIESARRASEIHKRRTGRALRVSEQDVINEEMYEEEDDDLQSQYRRLQAHLGSSADLFNGRLNAWVLSQYGTRQMAIAAQNGMSFNPGMSMPPPNTPFFAYQPQPQSPTSLAPGMTQRNQSYRQTPYPQQYQRMSDQRSHSIGAPKDQTSQSGMAEADMNMLQAQQRRQSIAASVDGHSSPGTPQSQGDQTRPSVSGTTSNTGMQPGHFGQSQSFNDQQFANNMSPQFNFNGFPGSTLPFNPMMNQGLFTTQMPPDAQQIIGTSFDPNSQFQSMYMNMSHGQQVPPGISYTYRPNGGSSHLKSESEGINQTLSPNPMASAPTLEANVDNLATPGMTNDSVSSPEQFNPHYSSITGLDNSSFGFGMGFDKTPGELTNVGTPDDGFFCRLGSISASNTIKQFRSYALRTRLASYSDQPPDG